MDDPSQDDISLANEDSKISYNAPALRNARELHLKAEEKWIVEALNKIKQQRNSLKVEYLYFQGLKAELLNSHGIRFDDSNKFNQILDYENDDNAVENSAYETAFQNYEDIDLDECKEQLEYQKPVSSTQTALDMVSAAPSNMQDFQILEEHCNTQELQLDINAPQIPSRDWDIEDPETESDEEEEEWSKVNLDMEMLVGDSGADM